MIWLLALVVTAVVVGGVRAALRPSGVELNHVVLFSFGLCFYWLIPVAAGSIRVASDLPELSLWYGAWAAAAESGAITNFLVFTLVTYGAFLTGDTLGRSLRTPRSPAQRELVRDPRLLWLFAIPILAITLIYAWQLRAELFSGYQSIYGPGRALRGTLSACSLALLVICLLRWAETSRWPHSWRGWLGTIVDPFVVTYVISAVLVLSLGGRLYVVSAAIIALVFHTVYQRALPPGRTLLIAVAAMALAGAAGTLRLGRAPTPMGIAVNVLAEPLFTGLSLLDFLTTGQAPWLAAPRFLVSDFVNLVPSAVFPGKAAYLMNPADYGYTIFAPLGALNSYISLTINFGIIGTPLVIFMLGFGLALLKRRRTVLARVVYSMLSGWLAFTFFRDAFSISVVKNMFEFSVVVPVLLVWSSHVMTVIAPRRPWAPTTSPIPHTTASGA